MLEEATNTARGKLDEFKLRDELRALRTKIPDTPALNPIVSLAFDLSRRLEAGDIGFEDVHALSVRLMDRACVHRARHLREHVGYIDDATTYKEFADYVEHTAKDGDFDAFKARWERARTGIVLTAHPTFGLSEALSQKMAEIALTGGPENQPVGTPHRPDSPLTLDYEHASAQTAVKNLRDAYIDLLERFYRTAAGSFGDKAFALAPQLATFASWVGYDLDGRNDIGWSFSFLVRIKEKQAALNDIRDRFLALRAKLGDGAEVQRLSRQITGKLDLAIAAVDEQITAIVQVGRNGVTLAEAANLITKPDGYNIVSTEPLTTLFEAMIAAVPDEDAKCALAALCGLLKATGLGTAHIHLRVNAVQINNAFRAFVHEPWTHDLTERQALARIVEMIRTAKPETVNFETLDLETATAIRQFALAAQIAKHVDRDTPIRYLIAESESPATILIAVFFAKLFGVEKIVDISPLFETPTALETGPRLVERLLAEEAYREYVRGRGRICVQTGYSDAGRFIGQIAAGLAHERLHFGLAKVIHKAEIPGVETLIFSTHGESMGRGAYPGPMQRRLRYVFSGEARWRFFRRDLPVKHETSYQGGDGYLFFANRAFATRVLATTVISGKDPGEGEDPFYTDVNLALDFQLRLRDYQQHLFAHPGYRALLGAFGTNLLFKVGSRPVKRQGEHASERGDPARMRAIPNNAILQQFGYVANVVSGLGAALGSERDRFVELAKRSPRLRALIDMIARAKQLSSLNAVGANALPFDAGFWTLRAAWGREPEHEAPFKTLAAHLLEDGRADAVNGLAHHLRLDAIELHSLLEDIGVEGGKIPDDIRLELDLLQAIRLTLIMRIFILAAQLPRFTTVNDVTYAQIFRQALALEIPEVVGFMRQAFPHQARTSAAADAFKEPASYRPHSIDDYGRLETEILVPMEEAYELVREIGTGITHHWGAFG